MRRDNCKTLFTMMTTDRIDASLPFFLKEEQNICNNGNDSDVSSDNISDLSVLLPSLSNNNCVLVDESNNDFLRLTTTVRTVYLSYLHKCLLSNYTTCCKQNDSDTSSIKVKKCANQMELSAVQLALEASLYRQNMLRMIADVKSHTIQKKAYKKLVIYLETLKDKIDIAIQTDDTWMNLEGVTTQNVSIISNCDKTSQIALSTVNSNNICKGKSIKEDLDNETDMRISQISTVTAEFNNASQRFKDQIDFNTTDDALMRNEDDNSQDSLLQHMQDMFCESDDSSDLTRLIEKHSGITKANIDKEINKICLEADIVADSNIFGIPLNNIPESNVTNLSTSEGRISFSRYKEMQSRKVITSRGTNANETIENKQKQKRNAIWFVERVHQVSKLKAKMTELSLMNYRRHGKIKKKFLHLFGDSEEEEMMPDSPICIEDHLPACKERIAPWIVKYLMPFYKKRRIKDRQLFKAVAKYIADMLIIENTFPEQECVSKYIENYFKNKRFIKSKQDIYL